jgi:O-antigen/teichoic acid export membrane protein
VTRTSRPSRFARNAASNWLTFLLVAVVSFFLSPFIVHQLGNTAYGVWTLLAALVGYFGLLDFGVRGAVTRYVAHHYATGDHEGCSSIVSAGMVMFGLLGVVAILLSGVFAVLASMLFNIPESLVNETRIVLLVGGATVAISLVGGVFGGVVAGLERFDVSNGVEIAVMVARTISIVVALLDGYGIVALALINLAASILNGLTMWAIAHKLYPELRLLFRAPLLPHMRTILSFSVLLSVLHVFGVLSYYSDALVIAVFLPVSSVTFFAIAGNLCEYARQVASAVSVLMTPRVSALASAGSSNVGCEILGAARLATLVTAPIAATFWFRGESFINLWMGTEYGPASGEVLRILAFVVLLGGARSVAIASIIGVNKHRTLIPAYGCEAACNVALSVALVGPFGLVGVALGTAIPSLVMSLGYIPRCLAKSLEVPASVFYRNAWLLPMVACVPFALANVLLEHLLPATNLAVFFLQVILTLPLVVASAMVVCLTPAERKLVTSGIAKAAALARRSIVK